MSWFMAWIIIGIIASLVAFVRTLMKRMVVPDLLIVLAWIWGGVLLLSIGTGLTRNAQKNDREEKAEKQAAINQIIDDYDLKSMRIWWDTDDSIYDHKVQFLTKDGEVCDGTWYEFGGKYYLRDDASCEKLKEPVRK